MPFTGPQEAAVSQDELSDLDRAGPRETREGVTNPPGERAKPTPTPA